MLLSPEGLVQLAQADVQYSQLCTNSWGKGGQAITYTYDENGSVETKTTVELNGADPESRPKNLF